MKCVLDTMVKGCEIDPSLLFDEQDSGSATDNDEDGAVTSDSTKNEVDGPGGAPITTGGTDNKTLYKLISESEVEVCSQL